MPAFLHLPTQRTVFAEGARAARYRRNDRFVELDPSQLDADSASTPIQSFASPDSGSFSEPDAPTTTEWAELILVGVSDMTVSEVLKLVDADRELAERALTSELAGRNRVTLIDALRKLT